MTTFHFSCTACGKCCNSTPSFYFSELLEQSANFVISVSWRFMGFYDPSKKKDISIFEEYLKKSFGNISRGASITSARLNQTIGKTNGFKYPFKLGSGKPYIVASFTDVEAHNGKCVKLKPNGECSIYSSAPSICRLVPMISNMSLKLSAEAAPQKIKESIQEKGWECDISEKAEPMLRDGKVLQEKYIRAHEDAHIQQAAWLKDTDVKSVSIFAFDILADSMNMDSDELAESIFEKQQNSESLVVDLTTICMSILTVNPSMRDTVVKIIENQIQLIQSRLNDDIIEDQEILYPQAETKSKSYKKLLQKYIDFLSIIEENFPQ